MKAVVLDKITEGKDIILSEIPIPEVRPGWVLVKVKAFGLNHSEKLLRLNEIRADYIQKPVIPGIECVGEIVDASDSGLGVGQKVAALMGGMGRSFNGSYAEYALLPRRIVFTVNSNLSWEDLGAVPETYFTAWGSLFECLHLIPNDIHLIRGGIFLDHFLEVVFLFDRVDILTAEQLYERDHIVLILLFLKLLIVFLDELLLALVIELFNAL